MRDKELLRHWTLKQRWILRKQRRESLKALDLEMISSNVQFLWRRRRIELLLVCGEKGESQVYFVKLSKLETQHDFHEILLTRYWNSTKQVGDPTWSSWIVKKKIWVCGKLCKVKQAGDLAWHSQNLLRHYWNTTKQVGDPAWSAQNVSAY